MDYCCSASQVHRRGTEAFYARQCALQSRQTPLIEAETYFNCYYYKYSSIVSTSDGGSFVACLVVVIVVVVCFDGVCPSWSESGRNPLARGLVAEMNPVNATSLYVSASRSVLQCDPRDPRALAELCKLLPFFRQSLSCLVCGE